MLSFKDNFFFLKFSVLFFIVTIFGYWGIDLNSEELYIAFSFFFLVILAFLLSRNAVVFYFSKSVNRKYSRLLSNFVRIRQLLRITERNVFKALTLNLRIWYKLETFRVLTEKLFFKVILVSEQVYLAKMKQLVAFSVLGSIIYTRNSFRIRKFNSFSGKLTRLFSISI